MRRILFAVLICWALSAFGQGEFEVGLQAIQRKDYAAALVAFKAAEEAGDKRADHALGMIYLNGLGVEKDPKEAIRRLEKSAALGYNASANMLASIYLSGTGVDKDVAKAREWARRSAHAGDAQGAYLVYTAMLQDPDLQYIENGKANDTKYFKLAGRPVSERAVEIEGYDMLARAVRMGLPAARLMLASVFIDKPGEGNNAKALAILQAMDMPQLSGFRRQLEELKRMGETHATLKLVRDAQATALLSAMIGTGRLDKDSRCPAEKVRLVKMAVLKPIEGAEYLPLKEPGMEKAYLLHGTWQENWSYEVCGQQVEVPMTFRADGYGGAQFVTVQQGLKPGKERI